MIGCDMSFWEGQDVLLFVGEEEKYDQVIS